MKNKVKIAIETDNKFYEVLVSTYGKIEHFGEKFIFHEGDGEHLDKTDIMSGRKIFYCTHIETGSAFPKKGKKLREYKALIKSIFTRIPKEDLEQAVQKMKILTQNYK